MAADKKKIGSVFPGMLTSPIESQRTAVSEQCPEIVTLLKPLEVFGHAYLRVGFDDH